MLWAIVAFLFFFWALGIFFRIAGKVIHLLLIVAIILLLVRFIQYLLDSIGIALF